MEKRRGYSAFRMLGQPFGSRRRSASHKGGFPSPCKCTVPTVHRASTRKAAAHRTQRESTRQKDPPKSQSAMFSDHTYVANSNHRRSSFPMDYRWLAGMTPKWEKRGRSASSNQRETSDAEKKLESVEIDNSETVSSISDMSQCYDACRKDSVKIESLSGACLSNAIQNCQYFIVKSAYSQPRALLKPVDQAVEKCNIDRSYVLDSGVSDCLVLIQAPEAQFAATEVSESVVISQDNKETESVKLEADESTMCSLSDVVAARPEPVSEGDTREVSDTRDTMYKSAACCSSSCDCFSFCDFSSFSIECENDTVQRNKVVTDDWGTIYIGCDGSHIVTCDLHLVGALETVSDGTESTTAVIHKSLASAADSEHEDFVDNTCVDCGCELASDDMTECVYSVPICSICSNDGVPYVDVITSSDHSYARLSTDNHVCPPSPLKLTHPSSPAVGQQPETPDTDIIDDITFLSFPSKLLMHKYIVYQQSVCDPAVRSSWTELARCQRSWHGSHKSHHSVWFGSSRHRHIDRFSAHNRLNEQIELGLVKPISAQNSADLLGIKLKSSLVHDNANKGGKLKCRNRQASADWQSQRPTRMAAKGQHYSLTRYWQRRNGLRRDPGVERIDLMKLTHQQAEDALELLQVPSIVTRKNCRRPGCQFGCICHLFARNKFASVIGAEFNSSAVMVPEYLVIDDSWRQSLVPSADSSLVSDVDDSPSISCRTLDISHEAASMVSSIPVSLTSARCRRTVDSESLATPQFRSDGQKCRGKHISRTRYSGRMSDNSEASPAGEFPHRRRRLKRRKLSTPQPVGDDNAEGHISMQESLKQNQSQTLPLDNNTHAELGEIHSRKRRKYKRRLAQTDTDNHTETVPPKRRRLRASKMAGDATVPVTQPKMKVLKPKTRDKVAYSDMHIAFSSGGNAALTNNPTVANSASRQPQLALQNVSTGTCYLLQPMEGTVGASAPVVPASNVCGVTVYAQPTNKAADAAKCRLILPGSCRLGMIGRPLSALAYTKQQSSASKAAIPRLVCVPASKSRTVSSGGGATSAASDLLKHSSSLSTTVSAPSVGSRTIPSSSSVSAVARSILKQSPLPKSTSVSVPSTGTTTSSTSSSTPSTSSQAQPFRTQMILFQQKQNSTASSASVSGKTRLLEIISNCAWEHIRPKVLTQLSELTTNSDDYPQLCVMSVDGLSLEVLPKSKEPTVIPLRLRASLGISSMFAVRVRITAGMKSGTASSVSVPSVAKLSPKLKVYNGLKVGSLHGVSLDGNKQGIANTDVVQQMSNSPPTRHDAQERSISDVGQPPAASLDIRQQKTDLDTNSQSTPVDVGQHMPTGLSENSDLSSKDDADVSKSQCRADNAVTEASSSVETTTQDASDCYIVDHCSDNTCSDTSGRIKSDGSVENSDSGTVLPRQAEDHPVIKNASNSISAECSEVANGSLGADDERNFVPSADDVNYPSSSGLSVPVACPLDLRT